MFVGCSEISISAIVKHVQHTGITRVFYLSGEAEKIVQLLFVRKGISTQGSVQYGKVEVFH